MWRVTRETVRRSRGSSRPRRASRSPASSGYEARAQASSSTPRRRSVLAIISLSLGGHQPVPVPATRRRPHLLGAGREGARPADAVQRDRAGQRVGFLLVIFLFVIGLSNDIERLRGERLRPAVATSTEEERGLDGAHRRQRAYSRRRARRRSPRRFGTPSSAPDEVAIRTRATTFAHLGAAARPRRRARRRARRARPEAGRHGRDDAQATGPSSTSSTSRR